MIEKNIYEARLNRGLENAVMAAGLGFYLFFSLRLVNIYPFEWISSFNAMPAFDFARTGELRYQYQLLYSSTDRMYANPPLYFILLGAVFKLFGVGVLQIRLFSIAINLLIFTGTFLLVKSVLSRKAAVFSVFVLALSDIIFSYSFCARPNQLAIMFFIFALLLCAKGNGADSNGWSFGAGFVMGLSAVSHSFILSYGLIPAMTLFSFKRGETILRRNVMKGVVFLAGMAIPVSIYLLWVGRDIHEWWSIQRILSASDATGSYTAERSGNAFQNLYADFKYFLHWNFLHTSIGSKFDPYFGQAIHRKYEWLGFQWGRLYLAAGLYAALKIAYGVLTGNAKGLHGVIWIFFASLISVISAGILFPKGVGNEYVPPVFIILSMLSGLFLSDLVICVGKNKVVRYSVPVVALAVVFLVIFKPRLSYSAGLIREFDGQPTYGEYMGRLQDSLAGKGVTAYLGPHFVNMGLSQYRYIDYFVLKDKSAIGVSGALLRDSNALILYDTMVTFSVVFNPIGQRLVDAGFYKLVGSSQSAFYGRTSAYLRPKTPAFAVAGGPGGLAIDFQDGLSHLVRGLFIKGKVGDDKNVSILYSHGDKAFSRLSFKDNEVTIGENGLLLTPVSPVSAKKIRVTGVGAVEYARLSVD